MRVMFSVLPIFLLCLPGLFLGLLFRSTPPLRRFFLRPKMLVLCGMLCLVALTCACGFLSAVQAMLPGLETLAGNIIAFVLALKGGQVPAATITFIQNIGTDISTEITNIKLVIAAEQANPNATTLEKLQAAFGAIVTNLQSILSGANIVDTATVSTLTSLVGLAIGSAQVIIGLIAQALPSAALFESGKLSAAHVGVLDRAAGKKVDAAHKDMKEHFGEIQAIPTGSADVDAALATLQPIP